MISELFTDVDKSFIPNKSNSGEKVILSKPNFNKLFAVLQL